MTSTHAKAIIAFTLSVLLWGQAFAQTDEGQAFLEAGDARAAMIRFERAVRQSPDDLEARLGLAQSLLRLGEFERAEKMSQVVYRRNGSPEAAITYAEALFGLGRYAEAETALKKAKDHADEPSLMALITAERALSAGDPVGALRAVRDAQSHPRLGTHARLIGAQAQYARRDYVRARRLVELILDEESAAIPALQLSARLALRSGDTSKARTIASKVEALDPGNVEAGSVLVEVALKSSDHKGAREALRAIVPRDANDPRPAFLEAMILLDEGDVEKAGNVASTIERWLQTAPGGAVLLGRIKIDTDRMAQAEMVLRQRVAAAPEDHAARRMLIEVYDRTDRAQRGDEALAEGVRLFPEDHVLSALKTERLLARGDVNAAVAMLQKEELPGAWTVLSALRATDDTTDAEDLEAIRNLISAQAALRQNDPEGAVRYAEAAAVEPAFRPVVGNILAGAAIKRGDVKNAKRRLDDLIAQYPDYLAAIEGRAALDSAPSAFLTHLERAVQSGAVSAAVLGRLAIERYVSGDRAGALTASEKLRTTGDATMEDQLITARIFLAEGQYEDALTELRRVVAQAEKSGTPLSLSISDLFRHAGDTQTALSLAITLANGGEDRRAALFAADLHRAEAQLNDAIILLTLTHAKNSDDKEVAVRLLEALSERNYESAIAKLEQSPRLRAFDTPSLRAKMMAATGEGEAARRLLSKAPASVESFVTWAMLAETPSQKQVILDRLVPLTKAHPENVPLLLLASSLAAELGQKAIAEDAIAAGLAVVPNDPILLNNLAMVRLEEDPDAALIVAKQAYQARPHTAEIAKTYVEVLKEAGKSQESAQLRRRLALRPAI